MLEAAPVPATCPMPRAEGVSETWVGPLQAGECDGSRTALGMLRRCEVCRRGCRCSGGGGGGWYTVCTLQGPRCSLIPWDRPTQPA